MITQQTTTAQLYRHAWLWFLLAIAVTITGFFKSFVSKFTETDLLHHFHGLASTGWMLLLVIQPFVYSRNRMHLHRKLGKLSFLLAPLLVISGFLMMHLMLSREGGLNPFTYMISFLDLLFITQFLFFYVKAIMHRRNLQLHARYMAGTVLALLPPGLGRATALIPGLTNPMLGLDICYFLLELTSVILIIDDRIKGRIFAPYVIALVFFLVQHICMHFAAEWPVWQQIVQAFAGL